MDQKTPLSTLLSGELEGTERFLDYGDVDLARRASALTLRDFCKRHRACRPEVMGEGLSFLMETAKESRCVYPLYEEGECREDETKRDVRLYAFPGGEGAEKRPVVLICAGGGYAYVCNIVEGFPVAKRFCDQGYDAYVLNYRVGTAPALPRASEDLERAVRFVTARKRQKRGRMSFLPLSLMCWKPKNMKRLIMLRRVKRFGSICKANFTRLNALKIPNWCPALLSTFTLPVRTASLMAFRFTVPVCVWVNTSRIR